MTYKMTESQLQESFEQYLDDVHTEVTIAGITFSASRVLREMDPIAFQVYMSDYASASNMDIEVVEEHELWDAEFNESMNGEQE